MRIKHFIKYFLLFIALFFCHSFSVYAENNFEITNIKVVENSGDMQIEDLDYHDNTITSSITFNTINDFITLEFEVKNNTGTDYQLLSISNNFEGEYLFINDSSVGEIVKAGDIHSYRVRIQYDNELLNQNLTMNSSSISLDFAETLNITNPQTNNSIYILVLIVFLMFLSGLVFFKKGKKVFILLLCLIPTLVVAQEGNSITISFDNISINGRFLEYDIQLDDGSGNVQTISRTYGEAIGDLGTPSKEGYNFNGWFDQNDNEITSETIITGSLRIHADYSPIVYSITYDLDGGSLSSSNPETYTIESDSITLNNPSKAGYTFSGWSEGNSTELQTSVTIYPGTTGNKTFTANYSRNQNTPYTVIHKQMDMNGNYVEYERETLYGATDTSVTPQTKTYTGFTAPSAQTKNINGDGSTTFTYNYSRNQYTFTITDRTNMNSSTTANGTYYYGTTITISAKQVAGYTLSWSDGSTSYSRSFTLTSNTTLTPTYDPNTNTRYIVIHKQMDLNGTTYTTKDTEYFTGTTNTQVTPAVNTYEGFTSPSTQTITIAGDGNATVTYLYTRNQYTLTLEDSEYVTTTTPSGSYFYGTQITLTAKEREGFEFSKWSDNHVSNPYTFTLTGNLTISPQYNQIRTDVCADNENVTTLSSTKCTNNENVTIGNGTVCKRAIQLHQETCSQTDSTNYCSGAGYTTNGSKGTNIITYGNCGTSGTLTSGDAFTCDVNGDGTFDELTERFYYVSDYFNTTTKSFDSTIAVLVYYNNVTSGVSCNKNTYAYDTNGTYGENWHGPNDNLKSQLPTTSQWSNMSLKNTSRAILAEYTTTHNATSTSGGTLPTSYSYEGYAARFLTAQELMRGCGLTQVGNSTLGELDSCHYLMENTKYSKSSLRPYGHWLETPNASFSNNVWFVYGNRRSVSDDNAYYSGSHGARPTIEVAKNDIEYGATRYTVSFNTDGGSSVSSQSIISGLYATRPSTDPTKSGYEFVNWYADSDYNTVFDFDNTPITNNKTIYAKFDLSPLLSVDNENVTTLSSTTCTNNENVTIGNGTVCKRAIQLHQETCEQTSTAYYCSGAGYTTNGSKGTNIITYGNCGTNGTLTSGDAFTCDVNGDGEFDELTERFYYVSDYFNTTTKSFDSTTAVLVYYNNVKSGVSCNKNTYAYSTLADIQAVDSTRTSYDNWHGPLTLQKQLPTTTQWSNISLKNTSRAILAEYTTTHNATSTSGGTLPTSYSYEGYAARFLTAQELMRGCGLTQVGNFTYGELDSCHYLMENTSYSKSSLKNGHWLETPIASSSNGVWGVYGDYRSVYNDYAFFSGLDGARPTIEVAKSKISY